MDPSLAGLDRFSAHLTFYFNPSDLPKFWAALKPIYDIIAQEPELVYFDVFEDPSEPGKIFWIENWEGTPQWAFTVRFWLLISPHQCNDRRTVEM